MRVDCERREIAFVNRVLARLQRLVEIVQGGNDHRRHRKKK